MMLLKGRRLDRCDDGDCAKSTSACAMIGFALGGGEVACIWKLNSLVFLSFPLMLEGDYSLISERNVKQKRRRSA